MKSRMTEGYKESIEMEDNKYYKDELQKLGIEDLESVAGGYLWKDMTEEDRRRIIEVDRKWKKALIDLGEGRITDAEYDAITDEMKETHRMMINKYDRK
jgi:hypothetical protein